MTIETTKFDSELLLIFASKKVGLETLKFILKNNLPIEKVVVTDNTDKYNKQIIKLINIHKIDISIYHEGIQEEIIANNHKYNWILNLWSPKILKSELLSLANHRLNIHSGLVPICRGNDNALWCIRNRLPAGVALLEIDKNIDCGKVYVQKRVKYSFPIKGIQLHQKIQKTAISLFNNNWNKIYQGIIDPKKQQGKITNYFKRKFTENDRYKNENTIMSLKEFINWIQAHDFYPGTTAETSFNGKKYKLLLKIIKIKKII
jgi:methionyl-tRNA formyltransferase